MKRIYLSLVIMLLCLSQAVASIIIPPKNVGEMAINADLVVYGKITGHQYGLSYLNTFDIIEVIKGEQSNGEQIIVEEYSRLEGDVKRKIDGDTDFEIGQSYLLFLHKDYNGNFRALNLAMSVYQEGYMDDKIVFAHEAAFIDLHIAQAYQADFAGLRGVYESGTLRAYLKAFTTSTSMAWDSAQAGLVGSPPNLTEEFDTRNTTNNARLAPCPNDPPAHCTTLFGTPGDPGDKPGKYADNNWTVCVAGGASSDPSNTAAITNLQQAITALNGMTGINITYTGIDAAATPVDCASGDAADNVPGWAGADVNKVYVFFDDPCNQIGDLTGCSGVLGVGGSFAFGTCQTDICGNEWITNVNPFFIMNNGSGCVGEYSYTAVLIHELLHALGVGHIAGACTALMNPSVCNANAPTDLDAHPGDPGFDGAPDYGITALDEACTDWMYNPSNTSTCNISNVMVTNVMCSAGGVLTFDVTFDYVDADDDGNGSTTFDVEVGGTGVTVTSTVINSGTVNTGNATITVSQPGPTGGGTVTVRSGEVFACFGEDLTVIVPACPEDCPPTQDMTPTPTIADVCAGSDVIVNWGAACNYNGLLFNNNFNDPTCLAADPTWTDRLIVPSLNIFDSDPSTGPATLLGFDDALGGCENVTLDAADFPNTTCDPIDYTVYILASNDFYCVDINDMGMLVSFGDYMNSDFPAGCSVIPVTFTVNPVPMVAPTVSNSGCSYTINFNCATESGSATFPSSPPAPAGMVDILVTNSQGGCSTNFTNIPFTACVPVELTAFVGEYSDGINYLNWETATELNNDHFVVEHSLDGAKFSALGKVRGAGTTIEPQRYEFMDVSPSRGVNYYRLKQVDSDGSYEYSDVLALVATKGTPIEAKVYPSPTSTFLNVETNQAMNSVEIVDLTGRVLLEQICDGKQQSTRLDVEALPVGTYFVNIKLDETVKLMRFVKD